MILRPLLFLAVLLPIQFLAADDTKSNGNEVKAVSVVLELFTSQGCSSCPPADKVLRRLGREKDVIALSFHVDYWNRLGWTDPFSDKKWTRRQEAYAVALGKDGLYTPQVVVDGSTDTVGSNVTEILAAIDRRRAVAAGQHRVDLSVVAVIEGSRLGYEIHASDLRAKKKYEIELFVTESGLSTEVPLGENANRTLYHDNVVRSGEVRPFAGSMEGTFEVSPSWDLERLGLVAVLRSKGSRSIVGAAKIDV